MRDTKPKSTILIIDDDESFACGVRDFLVDNGYAAFVHTNPITVPFVVREIEPDLVLLDVAIPVLAGPSFLKAGGRKIFQSAPVILFSGIQSERLARLCGESGADGYLSKSSSCDDILDAITLHLSDQRRATQH
jgi:DNA-binding response OmpR family regulator